MKWFRITSNIDFVFIGILLCSLGALLYRLADPEGSLIFDEAYYVQMARVMLGWPVFPYNLPSEILSGCDPNSEHPPLAKVIMATFMYWFGETGIGWRLPSVCLGLIGVAAVYGVVRQLGGTRNTARLAAFLLAFDNLYFIHSRIATLDIYMVSFCLVGVWLYVRGWPEFAGLAFGLGTCCKINGLLWVGSIFLYEAARAVRQRFGQPQPSLLGAPDWRRFGICCAVYIPFTYLLLGLLDCLFTQFRGPLEHIFFIFSYGAKLSREVGVETQGPESTPLQWWLNRKEFEYLGLRASANDFVSTLAAFTGCMSMYLIAAAPFALVGNVQRGWRGNKLALLAFCLFVGNYVPMLLTWIKVRRISYIFYMVPSLPAFSIAVAGECARMPRWVGMMLVLATVYSFVSLFPFPLF